MSNKSWKPWCCIDHCSATHHADVVEKARYDTKPSKSAGWGANMPSAGLDNVVCVNTPTPGTSEDPVTRADRLKLIEAWGSIKEQELSRRPDSRFCNTLVIPVPNELSLEVDVQIGAEVCTKLFGQEYAYSFSIHQKGDGDTTGTTTSTAAAARIVANNHIHVMFSERNLVTGLKGSGGGRRDGKHGEDRRPFKEPSRLRAMVNDALADSLRKRGYRIGANTGADKKVRLPRGEYEANRYQEQAEIAVAEAEKRVQEKRVEVEMLRRDLREAELEKSRQLPGFRKVRANLDKAERSLKNTEIQVQLDRIQQRSQNRIKEAEKYRTDKDDRSSRTRETDRDREPDGRGGMDR